MKKIIHRISVVTCRYRPLAAANWFSRVMAAGWRLKEEVFSRAIPWPNLYLFKIGLLSKKFLSGFCWDENFQEDSYCYRRALQSKLPIVRSAAAVDFKLVDNFHDYLWQSAKFQKAMALENQHSSVYLPEFAYLLGVKILARHWLRSPLLVSAYLLVVFVGRALQYFLPRYHRFWKIYSSSKKLAYV